MKGSRVWMLAAVGATLVAVLGGLAMLPPLIRAKPLPWTPPPPPSQFKATGWISQPSRPLTTSLPAPHLGYGVNVRHLDNIEPLFQPLGLEWIKLWDEYDIDPTAERLGYQVLFAIEYNGMVSDLDTWGDHVEAIASASLGYVEAYEIGNEPNVDRFWGNAPPDPAQYVQVLQVAYQRIKAVDPAAIVVSAGLAPVGRIEGSCNGWSGNNCSAMDEREYARQMLLLGAGDYFDAFGYHPYGFAYEPEVEPHVVENGFAFRGTEVMYDLLVQHGLAHKPIWATEFNWLRDWTEDGGMPSGCLPEYESVFGWMEVTGVQQANYITRAFQYADANWPWMGAMFIWNLDWHTYHTWDCEAAHHFSLRRNDSTELGATTPAYQALRAMVRRPGHFGPRLAVEPAALNFLADVDEPGIFTATIDLWNSGYRVLTWTVTVSTGMQVTPTLAITSARQGTPLTITVDSRSYPTGVFTGSITVATILTDVLDAPQTVGVTLTVERFDPQLAIQPSALNFLADVRKPTVLTGVVVPTNTGYHVLTWTASVAAGMAVTGTGSAGPQIMPTLVLTTGLQGTGLTVTLDTTGYTVGTFVGLISVTAAPTNVQDSPQIVPVLLRVVPEMHQLYLPLSLRVVPRGTLHTTSDPGAPQGDRRKDSEAKTK